MPDREYEGEDEAMAEEMGLIDSPNPEAEEAAKEAVVEAADAMEKALEAAANTPTPLDPAHEWTMDEIKKKKKARIVTAWVQIDGEIASEIEETRERYQQALRDDRMSNLPDKAPKIKDRLDALLESSRATVVPFKMRSIGRTRFEALVRSHKPDQHDKKEGSIFNTRTFPPALIAEASVAPKITLDEAKEMFADEEWNNAELLKIFFAAQSANAETPDIPLSSIGLELTNGSD